MENESVNGSIVAGSVNSYASNNQISQGYLSNHVITDNESARLSNTKSFAYNGVSPPGPYNIKKIAPNKPQSRNS